MKIVTVLGTRPEIIRLSLIIALLDRHAEEHTLVHTGQNYVPSLSGIFFSELGIRQPDVVLSQEQRTLGEQLSVMYSQLERILQEKQPDKVLVLGDTNSALAAVLAERMGIPVVHMEAGNRCFDWKVPEEKNRRVIDHISSINMPYTPQSKQNLLREGIPVQRIVLTGNPIHEVLTHYSEQIGASRIHERLGLTKGKYFLVTVHRAENVDHPAHLREILQGLNLVAEQHGLPLVASLHPRTKSRMEKLGDFKLHPLITFHEPFGFFDFVALEKDAYCVLTDSGTVQEECCLFRVPAVTVRTTTERPETVDCGSNVVSGLDAERIAAAVRTMTALPRDWRFPEGYTDTDVSRKVVKYLCGTLSWG
ncbi:non-hydrolyzing UDP-N-acetylglucosamine 2-epimerase [Gorillibacterium sp. sgz5001074]|uniref:non-hydrolyzing UDP-N-acetylglucosamine 2-epimerase n=1 Tax=Gorillibacterium sp. sgz5001074 TaxID=3446695 RepID=UPI003F677EC1